MERTKVNFLSESAVEDIMGDPNNASSYNFTEQCNKGSYSSSDLAGKKKDKWAKIFRAENQISLDNKKRVINCQSGDEKKALKLMEEIGPDKFEYYVYGGAYTEPLLNPYFMDFISLWFIW